MERVMMEICMVETPLGPRLVEVAITVKPTKRIDHYTAAVAAQMRLDAAARRARRCVIVSCVL